MTRRSFLPAAAGLGAATLAAQTSTPAAPEPRKGRLKQCVTQGVFNPRQTKMTLDDMCREAAKRGIVGFDLIGVKDWPTLKKYGLIPTMAPNGGGTIPDALNRKENHAKIEPLMRELINQCADAGAPNLITFSGNRRGMPDDEAKENCVLFLNKVKAQAEDKGVNICMELLNSKVNHPDYQNDHTAWGVDVCKRVNSPRVKQLYDIYHLQIMEGDIIRTIRENIQWIAHFHTGGNPGRNEIDDTQELNYRTVAKAIADLGFQGYVAHEYGPKRDALTSLDQAIEIMTV